MLRKNIKRPQESVCQFSQEHRKLVLIFERPSDVMISYRWIISASLPPPKKKCSDFLATYIKHEISISIQTKNPKVSGRVSVALSAILATDHGQPGQNDRFRYCCKQRDVWGQRTFFVCIALINPRSRLSLWMSVCLWRKQNSHGKSMLLFIESRTLRGIHFWV